MRLLDKFCVDRYPLSVDPSTLDDLKREYPGVPETAFELLKTLNGGRFRVTLGFKRDDTPPVDPWYEASFWKLTRSFSFRQTALDSIVGWFDLYDELLESDLEFKDFFPRRPLPLLRSFDYDLVIHPESKEIYATIHPFWDKPECVAPSFDELLNSIRVLAELITTRYSNHKVERLLATGEDETILEMPNEKLKQLRFGDMQWTLLHLSVIYRNWPLAQRLIERGFDPLETDAKENTLLHLAAEHYSFDSLRNMTLRFPELTNRKNALGVTALGSLMGTVRPSEIESRMIKWLLYVGADRDQSDGHFGISIKDMVANPGGLYPVFDKSGDLIKSEDIIEFENNQLPQSR